MLNQKISYQDIHPDTYTDFASLTRLKQAAKSSPDNTQTLQNVARQFESLFIDMALKNLRQANESFAEDDELNGETTQFYQDMFDHQLAINLSKTKGLGLADMIAKQLHQLNGNSNDNDPEAKQLTRNMTPDRLSSNSPLTPTYKALQQPPALLNKDPTKRGVLPLFESPVDFVKALWPHAVEAAKEIGTDPRVLVAQAALETRWGKSIIRNRDGSSSHNLFNIKADSDWNQHRTYVTTLEYEQGVARKQVAPFRSYPSFAESFKDYTNFLKANPRYRDALQRSKNPIEFAQALQIAGYATDPAYAHKIKQLFYSDTLNKALNGS